MAATKPDTRWHHRLIRSAVGSLAALALAGGLAATGAAASASASSAPSARVASAYTALTTKLDPRQRELLAEGLEFGELDDEQREHVLDLARSLLSEEAYAQFTAVMAADDDLDAASGGGTEYATSHYRVLAIDDVGGSFIQLGGTQVAINARLSDDGVWVEPDLL